MKPSDFAKIIPMSSVYKKSEHETVATNIMIILKRTGDTFRTLTWEGYKDNRMKDGARTGEVNSEKSYFDAVIPYCISAEKAQTFSPYWAKNKEKNK